MGEPLEVLFVCTANICRSPHMEHLARSLAGHDPSVRFASAGVLGFTGEPMDQTMAATLPGGTDGFRSRRLSAAMVASADLVLTAESRHRAAVLEEHPAAVRKTFTLGQFAAAVAASDPALHGRELVATIGAQRPAASAEHDIADPYRRGADAAQEAAGRISTMLSVIVKRLQEG
jgi:protein-tyrosine-phosphatase